MLQMHTGKYPLSFENASYYATDCVFLNILDSTNFPWDEKFRISCIDFFKKATSSIWHSQQTDFEFEKKKKKKEFDHSILIGGIL